jgi:D-glycerate 3-kinase
MRDEAAAAIRDVFVAERIAPDDGDAILPAYLAIAEWLRVRCEAASGPSVAGICGAQGSGKSTMSLALAAALECGVGLKVATLSIDDFYLSRAARAALARDVHPLFATRGVPGTHDVALACETIDRLRSAAAGDVVELPRFDKAIDDVGPSDHFVSSPDLILLEGWCVGAHPEPDAALVAPINALERDEDEDGIWRNTVNAQLAGPYRALFAMLDPLLMIAAPSFDAVFAWRRQQEQKLAARAGTIGNAVMDDAAVARFIMHYERLTRHILAEMPARADGLLRLDADRAILSAALQ